MIKFVPQRAQIIAELVIWEGNCFLRTCSFLLRQWRWFRRGTLRCTASWLTKKMSGDMWWKQIVKNSAVWLLQDRHFTFFVWRLKLPEEIKAGRPLNLSSVRDDRYHEDDDFRQCNCVKWNVWTIKLKWVKKKENFHINGHFANKAQERWTSEKANLNCLLYSVVIAVENMIMWNLNEQSVCRSHQND